MKSPPSHPGHRRAVFGMVLVLFIILIISDLVLINLQKRELRQDAVTHTQFELEEAAAFMVEPLLKYQFSDINQFIQNWSESHKDVIQFQAISPTGHMLSNFSRPAKTSAPQITVKKEIEYLGKPLLMLSMTKDLSKVENLLKESKKILLTASIIITCAIGITLWFVFRSFALRPLEQEVSRRQKAEDKLKEVNLFLEDRVRERTLELADRNIQLEEEVLQREELQQLLSTEKERLAVTLRSIGDGVITTDTDGKVVLLNRAAEEITGWTQDEAGGLPIAKVFSLVCDKTGESCDSLVEKILNTGGIVTLSTQAFLIDRGGRKKNIADSGAPIRDRESRIIGVVLVFRDITEKLRTDKELLQVEKLKSVGVLAGGIAHDFNNILFGILGNLNLATNILTPEHEVYRLLKDAEKASIQARGLTQQLLTFAKGGSPLKETASIAETIYESASFSISGSRTSCHFDLAEDLWLIDMDRGQISQVIQNLIINACHAMPGGGNIFITGRNIENISLEDIGIDEGKYIKITVTDNGVGMPENVIDKIFDPFYSTKSEGSGLGLAVTHSVITRHDGRIFVDSKPGSGTTFSLYLPASSQTETTQEKAVDEFIAPTDQWKVLVMDDDSVIKETVQTILEYNKHEVALADDGEEAIKLYQEALTDNKPFDVVLMDLTIPGGMGGKEAVKEILNIHPEAKVVVSSGYSSDPIMAEYTQYGFSGAVAKPYQMEELFKVINSALSKK